MNRPLLQIRFLLLALPVALVVCSEVEDELGTLLPHLGERNLLSVVGAAPFPGQIGVADTTNVILTFNRPINGPRCTDAFALSPSAIGVFAAGGSVLHFDPTNDLTPGSYVITLSQDCEDTTGQDLESPFTSTFQVAGGEVPYVQAVGLESQGCSTTWPGTGSASGGDHTAGSCWWDSSLPLLSPTNYEFRGGDVCGDVTTDNFRIVFSNYMDTGLTINAISLTRQSPPASLATIRKASWAWSDCQTLSPFGCRVVTVAFAEIEAACGTATTWGGNDFNMQPDTAIADFPLYTLEVDTTARTAAGINFTDDFTIGVEND